MPINNPLYQDIGCRVYNNADENTATGIATPLTFNLERYDTDTIHNITSNTDRLICQTSGKYSITGNARFDANAVGFRSLIIRLNGTDAIAVVTGPGIGAVDPADLFLATIYNLTRGDYLQLEALQTSGGNLLVKYIARFTPEFMMQKIG